MSLSHLAVLQYERGNYDEALVLQKRALEVSENAFGPTHPRVATIKQHVANLYYRQGMQRNSNHQIDRADLFRR
jgi:hypothetical protein